MPTVIAPAHDPAFADAFLPTFDVSDSVAVVVEAGLTATWGALLRVDLVEVAKSKPLVGVLGGLRALPELADRMVHGERPQRPRSLTLPALTLLPPGEGGWTLLGERPEEEIALGLVGRFWRPAITYADVGADEFAGFTEPGYAKTVYSLSVRALDEHHTLLAGLMRTATTDEHARRWFRRYWTYGIGSGAHVLVAGLLDAVRADAETTHLRDRATSRNGRSASATAMATQSQR